ncbi:acyltransferase [Singulisphaera sp. Ch08]|uniref:Acyltransferase n=1 Tax=Singulisphaera sp. Ch08 TaxID=3120278 RepID=A0AAU7CM03_9BACT
MKVESSISTPSVHLDFARGLAALLVLMNHGRSLFFVNYGEAHTKSLFVKFFYFFTAFGHEAVMVFFVLSGYFISSSILRARREGRWSWRTYLVDRSTRIYIVLIPAILLTVAWDLFGMSVYPRSQIYFGVDDHGLFKSPIATFYETGHLPAIIVGNLLCLQTIFVPTVGSNPALWSLCNEVFYYLIFPLALVLLAPGGRRIERFACAVMLAVVSSLLNGDKWFYFLIWLFGAGIAATGLTPRTSGRSLPRGVLELAVLWFGTSMVLTRSRLPLFENVYLVDFLNGGAFAALLIAILLRPSPSPGGLYPFLARQLSGFSYSLYVIHLPILVFLRATLLPRERFQPRFDCIALYLGVLALIVAYAFLFSRATEAKTGQARRAMASWTRLHSWALARK